MQPYFSRYLIILLAGLFLLITGGLRIPGFVGTKAPYMDPLFVRIAGILMIAGYVVRSFMGESTVLFIGVLVASVGILLVALIRGVTR